MNDLSVAVTFEPRNADYQNALERYVAAQDYLQLVGVVLSRAAPGEAVYRVGFRPDLGQQNGFFTVVSSAALRRL